jgi:hypothetical protein
MATSVIERPATDLELWPSLPLEEWQDTYATLHMWTQIVGKIRLAQTPWVCHSWHVTFEVTPNGLRTPPIPHGTKSFQLEFDFVDQQLVIRTSIGDVRLIKLRPRSVANFYVEVMATLRELNLPVRIVTKPNEVETAIRFEQDHTHAAYDPEYANRLWRILLQADRVLKIFRARFNGKCSPVHFFWGGFDLAVTRFSGRPAPPHPGGIPNLPDWITRDAYSHEVSSAGFGRAVARCRSRLSMPTPTRNRQISKMPPFDQARHFMMTPCANSSCPTMSCDKRNRRMTCCWNFCKARTKRRRRSASGTGSRSSGRPQASSDQLKRCAHEQRFLRAHQEHSRTEIRQACRM